MTLSIGGASKIIQHYYLNDALSFYEREGYRYREVPWCVGRTAYEATKPPGARDMYVPTWEHYLVASGEQGFIDMMLRGERLGRSVCLTPCFRDETYDELHRPWFMKVELIDQMASTTPLMERRKRLTKMKNLAMEFFTRHIGAARWVQTAPLAWDLVGTHSGIELGSYGIRTLRRPGKKGSLVWCYGTGVAEPRLSTVVAQEQRAFFDANPYLDQAMVNAPGLFAAYTPLGIHRLDSEYCARILKGKGSPKALAKEIEANPHLHRSIKDNLLQNLRKCFGSEKDC